MDPYLNEIEANAYFDNRMFTEDWDEAGSVERNKALRHSTILIDRLKYKGCKTVETQDREFPRGGDTTVPVDIQYACAEITLQLLSGHDLELVAEGQDQTKLFFGPATVNRDPNHSHIAFAHGIPSVTAWSFLKPYLLDPREVILRRAN